jgi:hypothetical protein
MDTTYFEEVYDFFFSKITTYNQYIDLSEEDLNEELKMLLRTSLSKFIEADNIIADMDMDSFNRKLTDLEMNIISMGMVLSWITQKVNSVEQFDTVLGSKDYTIFSQANHLKELMEAQRNAESDFHYWIKRYSLQKVLKRGLK